MWRGTVHLCWVLLRCVLHQCITHCWTAAARARVHLKRTEECLKLRSLVGTDLLWAERLYSLSATLVLPVGSSLDLEKREVTGIKFSQRMASWEVRAWHRLVLAGTGMMTNIRGGSCFFLDITPGRPEYHSLSNTGLEISTGFLFINRFQLLGPILPLSELLPSDALYFGSTQK